MDTQIGYCIMILLAAAGALADSTQYMNGILERVESNDNYTSCTFTVNGKNSPSEVHNKQICNFLLEAHQHNTPLAVSVTTVTDKYTYSAHFHNRNSKWADAKLETESFKYLLVGTVEDIYCTYSNNCYIAVNTGYDVRNNNVFHVTTDQFACEKALAAFYRGESVTVVASVDTTPSYSNNIERLMTTKCT